MYKLFFDGYPLYDPRGANDTDRLIIREPSVSLGVNMAGSMTFTLDPGHPHADKITKMVGVLELRDDAGVLFRGRVLDDRETFYKSTQYTAEGALAYLNDTLVEPYDFPADFADDPGYVAAAASGNVVAFFLGWLLDKYNAQAAPDRQIRLGTVTVKDPNNYISRADSSYPTTFEVISKKLVGSSLGGYLIMRYEEDGNYLDYLANFTQTNAQEITFGENLLDLVRERSGADLYTAVLPVGSDGLTLESLPDGPQANGLVKSGKILYNPQAEADYGGRITRKLTFDDVTLPANLLARAAADLGTEVRLPEVLQIKACDLHYLDGTIPSFRIGLYTVVVSAPHEIRKSYPLTELQPDILNPGATPITLNGTATQLTSQIRKQQTNTADGVQTFMQDAIKNATDLITGNKGGYVVWHSTVPGGFPEEILIMDTPDIKTATQVWRWNKAGLGYSSSGYNGPYGTAITQDGAIVADFITVGQLTASIIKTGILQSLDGDVFYLDLDKGILRLKAQSLEISGRTVGEIASDAASDAAADALLQANEYADAAAQDAAADALTAANKQAKAYADALNQYEIARRLTNNFVSKGIYLVETYSGSGVYNLYVNADYIRTGVLDLSILRLVGTKCGLKQGYGKTGGSSGRTTEGIVIYGNGVDDDGSAKSPYIIITDAGIRLQTTGASGYDYSIYLAGGNGVVNGNLDVKKAGIVNGDITADGRLQVGGRIDYVGGYLDNSSIWINKNRTGTSAALNAYTDANSGVNIAGWSYLSDAAWVGNGGGGHGLVLHGNDIQADVSVRVTSDRDAKKDIEPLEATKTAPVGASDSPQEAPGFDGDQTPAPDLAAQYEAFMDALTPVRFRYKTEPDDGPLHTGYIYQDAVAAAKAAGLALADVAALGEAKDEKGNVTKGIAYSELVALLHLKIKRQAAEITALAARIAALEAGR